MDSCQGATVEDDGLAIFDDIIDLFLEAGYSRASVSSFSPSEKVIGGLIWCISASNPDTDLDKFSYDDDASLDDKLCAAKAIEAALKNMQCPFPVGAEQIIDSDYVPLFPVVKWLARMPKPMLEQSEAEDTLIMEKIEGCKNLINKYQHQLRHVQCSLESLEQSTKEQDQKKEKIQSEISRLNQKVAEGGASVAVMKLLSYLQELKVLEVKESDILLHHQQKHAELQAQIAELRTAVSLSEKDKCPPEIESSLSDSLSKLASLQIKLAKKHQAVALLQRKLDAIPSHTELIQYEHRLAELSEHIQTKLRETRRYYGTYNALVEANGLILKEISLLNSISSQFENIGMSTSGRAKIRESMEAVTSGIQQKLSRGKVQCEEEQSRCNSIKEEYSNVIAEHRKYYSLIKSFQEECARHERLQAYLKTLTSG